MKNTIDCFVLSNPFKGDRGVKGEPGYIQKVDFNSTHIIMMGSPGLPGPKVRETFELILICYLCIFQGRIGLPGQPGFNGEKGDRGDSGSTVMMLNYYIERIEKISFEKQNE